MVTLPISDAENNHNFSADSLSDITNIVFNTSISVYISFAASQFDDAQIHHDVQITGDSKYDSIVINFGGASSFSAAQWVFVPGSGSIALNVNGSSAADTINGGDVPGGCTFAGGAGADQLTGGSGPDLFRYFSGAEIEAGESLDGGANGSDGIQVNCDGSSYDFSQAQISGVESLYLNLGGATGSDTVKFSGAQLGAGGITDIFDGSYTSTVIAAGTSVDLSGITFHNWTDGTDRVEIDGTAGADILIGSGQDDIFAGGLGKDRFTGGLGADDFDFNLTSDSRRGAKHDKITDFTHGSDHIDLDGIDAKKGGLDNDFHFIRAKPFHGKAGELHFVKHHTYLMVEGDVNGDGKADFQIEVHGVGLTKIMASDFDL